MNRTRGVLVTAVLAMVVLSGCASSGIMTAATLTNVELGEDDYAIVATDVSGTATAHYLLGFSAPYLFQAQAVAVARVGGSKFLYQAALEDLWASFAEVHGAVEGRGLALVNVRMDVDALNLILYTRPTLSITADVVEFQP